MLNEQNLRETKATLQRTVKETTNHLSKRDSYFQITASLLVGVIQTGPNFAVRHGRDRFQPRLYCNIIARQKFDNSSLTMKEYKPLMSPALAFLYSPLTSLSSQTSIGVLT